jgi:Ca2+-binding EF-hand superfamily protein
VLDFQKTLDWWHYNFSKINTHAMFNAVDQDRDGQISLDEWLAFWQTVRSHSHLDEEIVEELNKIRSGCSWVVFDEVSTPTRD